MAPGPNQYHDTPPVSSHKTKSRIMNRPGVLGQCQDLHGRYKTATSIVLRYLYSTGRRCKFAFLYDSSMTQAEMIQSARVIAMNNIKPQQEILWALQASIAGRVEMLNLYRTVPELQGDEKSDKNHKHFINILQKVKKLLFAGPKKSKPAQKKADSFEGVIEDMEDLDIEDEIEGDGDEDEDAVGTGSSTIRFYGKKTINPEALARFLASMDPESEANANGSDANHTHAPNDISVSDDQSSDRFMHMMETNSVLKEMQDTRAMTHIWDTYREGKIPLLDAAYLTHHIYETKSYFFRRCAKRMGMNDVATLIDRADSIRTLVHRGAVDHDMPGVLEGAFFVSDNFRQTLETVQDYRSMTEEQKAQLTCHAIINPRKHVPKDWIDVEDSEYPDDTETMRKCATLKMIMDTCRDVTVAEDFVNHIVEKQHCRCCGDGYAGGFQQRHISDNFKDDIPAGVEMAAVSGLSWSIDQYQRFLHGSDQESSDAVVKQQPNLRIKVLRFAQEISEAIKSAASTLEQEFPSSQELNMHSTEYLRKIQRSLDGFLSTSRFDLYSQAPWVAGSHLLGLWMFAMSNGVMICNESAFVVAVLHLYNAAMQLGLLSKSSMPVLDALCETLKEPFFRGKRPEFNFVSHFCTIVGGGFQNPKETEHKKRKARAKAARSGADITWELKAIEENRYRMTLPEHLPCVHSDCDLNPGYKFLSASAISASFQIAAPDGFRPRFEILAKLKGYGKSAAAKRRAGDEYWEHERQSLCKIDFESPSIVDEKETALLRETLQSEFSAGELPAPRVNWFLVFKLCADVMSALVDLDCPHRRAQLPKSCCAAATAVKLLFQLENLARGQKDSLDKHNWSVAKNAMEEAFMALKPEELLWQHLD